MISFITECVGVYWDLTDSEILMLFASVFIGMMVGALYWGHTADTNGRRFAGILSKLIILFSIFLNIIFSFYLL